MKCKHVQQKILEYSEKLLDEKARFQVEEHLQKCSTCAQELSDIEQTFDLLQSVPFPEPPESFWTDFTSGVMRRINKIETPSSARQVFFFPRFQTAMLLLVLIVILGGVYMYFNPKIQQFWHPVDTTAKLPGQGDIPQTSSGHSKTDEVLQEEDIQDDAILTNAFETPVNAITSKDLMQDMLESDLALFDGRTDIIIGIDYSDDMLYSLINNLTEEEKKALLSELHKMRDEAW